MKEQLLTIEAKEAIRTYLRRSVVLWSTLAVAIVTAIFFTIGFYFEEIVKQKAYNEAYKEASSGIIELTLKAAEAASKADESKKRLEELTDQAEKAVIKAVDAAIKTEDAVNKIAGVVKQASEFEREASKTQKRLQNLDKEIKTTREQLKTVKVVENANQFVDKVSDDIINRADFSNKLLGKIGDRVNRLETLVDNARQGKGRCSWVQIGFNKSHYPDRGPWCDPGWIIREIDVNSGRGKPYIAQVKCCELLPN